MADERTEIDQTLPPFLVSVLERGAKLEPIRLDRHGRWWHRGNPIEHPRIGPLFSRSVSRSPGGTWVLSIGQFTYPVEIDDTPLFVTGLTEREGEGQGELWVTLSDGSREVVSPDRLRLASDALYLTSVGEAGVFDARFLVDVYVEFVERYLARTGEGIVMRWNGRQVPVASADL